MLSSAPYNLPTVVLSLDDFYLTHDDQVALAAAHPSNPLVQHRGQPSTHDLPLMTSTLKSLHSRFPTKLPSYDKAAFNGAGDRTDPATWMQVNTESTPTIEVVILEGWCVGFRALNDVKVMQPIWQLARDAEMTGKGTGQLGKMRISDVRMINDALKSYDDVTE